MTSTTVLTLVLTCVLFGLVYTLPTPRPKSQQPTLPSTTQSTICQPGNSSCNHPSPVQNSLRDILKTTTSRKIATSLPTGKCVGSNCNVKSRKRRMDLPTRCSHMVWGCQPSQPPTIFKSKTG